MENKYIEWIPIFGSRIMWKRTLQDCPKLAERLNLKFQLSHHKEYIGNLSGHLRKHSIGIDIDDQKIGIGFKSDNHKLKDLNLSTTDYNWRSTSKDFEFHNKKLNNFFRTRQVSEELQKNISENKKLETLLLNFIEKYDARVGSLVIGSDLSFAYYGRGFSDKIFNHRKTRHPTYISSPMRFFHYIPIDFLENVIPDFIDILEAFEKIGQD